MFFIEQFVYTNGLRHTHPIERFLFGIVTMAMALVFKDWRVHLLIVLLMAGVLVLRAGIPFPALLKLMALPLGFLIIGVLTIALTISRTPENFLFAFSVGDFYLGATVSSMGTAMRTMSVSLSAVSCLYFLALTTPMVELIYVLQLFKLPDVVVELMVLIYRFIFVFIDTAFAMYHAQQSRCGHLSFRKSLHSFALLFANLWGKAFFKSKSLFVSLESRGYGGSLQVLNPRYTFSLSTIVFFIGLDLLVLTAGWLL